jgi:hypothetical protein
MLQKQQQELEEWQKKIDAMNHIAQKLIEDYEDDDNSKVKDTVEQANSKFYRLLQR